MKKRPQKECVFEYPDTIIYKTTCDCGSGNHSLEFEITNEKDIGLAFLIYTNLAGQAWDYGWNSPWENFKKRIKFLFTGYLEISTEFIFRNEDHVNEIGELMLNWKKEFSD